MNTTAAAALLCVHPKTVEDLIKNGSIPAAKVGRAWVMMTKDVLAYAERAITEQTAKRMGVARSPKRIGKVTAAQVAVSKQHPVRLVAADSHNGRLG